MKTKTINIIISILTVIAIYALLFMTKITCLVKYLFGISCPCCGMTRAWTEIFQLNIDKAFYFHPFFIFPVILIIGLFISNNNNNKLGKVIIALNITILIIVYAIRMVSGNNEIVSMNIENGIIYKIIKKLFGV